MSLVLLSIRRRSGLVRGNGQTNTRLIVRAIGPSLAAFGVTNALANPVVDLKDASGATLYHNDNLRESQETELVQVGLG